jgi:surface carbohydrate biosynthesis protein|tara:strand:+ start:245 stop:1426 length:1182 start_codon:yes stop_codon:yes gene_type:complete
VNKIIIIIKLFFKTKFIFKNPKQNNLIIFDDTSIDELKFIIKDYNYFILETRIKNITCIYLSFDIIFSTFKNYKGNFLTAYLIAIIDLVSPKAILTYIDNSHKFSEIARIRFKDYKFIALQNGARYEHKIWKYLYKKKYVKNYVNLFVPNFLCFSNYEIDDYKKNNVEVGKFLPVGNLRTANFYKELKNKKINIKKKYDICYISEPYAWDLMLNQANLKMEEGIGKLLKFTIKFSMENKMKFIIASRYGKSEKKKLAIEKKFYRKYLNNDELNYLAKNFYYRGTKFLSYVLMSQSEVVVSTMSTMLRENLYLKGKVLACNFTPTNIFNFPIKGICSLKNCSYYDFNKRLIYLKKISNKEYFLKIKKNNYYSNSLKNPTVAHSNIKKALHQLMI